MRLFYVGFDVFDGLTYGRDLLSLIVGNGDAKSFLKLHDEFYSIQRICAQIIGEAGLVINFTFFNTEFVNDDCFYFAFNF